MKIQIIYDNARADTIGIYCEKALKELGHEVTHCVPSRIISNAGAELYLYIDDGYNYVPIEGLRPAATWMIDTHLRYDNELARGLASDYSFVAQRDDITRLKKAGVKNLTWLPLACDPEIHYCTDDVEKKYDIAFVGTCHTAPFFRDRLELLDKMFKAFPNFFYGPQAHTEFARTYKESRIILNRSVSYDVNMRVHEAACSGSLLVTNLLKDIDVLYDKLIPQFTSASDCKQMISYYLKDEKAREGLAEKIRQIAVEKHTYKHRMKQLLEEVT